MGSKTLWSATSNGTRGDFAGRRPRFMFGNCVFISFGSHVDSPPLARRQSLRSRYACLREPLSTCASRQIRLELHSAHAPDRTVRHLWTASQELTDADQRPVAACRISRSPRRAQQSTTTARFSCRDQRNRWNDRRTIALAAQGVFARRMHVSTGSRRTEGLEDRPLLPQPPPFCLSRSHEEGNVDQRVATGGMPDRDC